MADYDVRNDVTPVLVFQGRGAKKPTIAALKAALTAFQAGTYTTAAMNTMTYNDLLYACQANGLAVVGI